LRRGQNIRLAAVEYSATTREKGLSGWV
jgi:hypothetical protein